MFECKHCGTKYVREAAFMAHECEPMRRKAQIQTMVGQRAFSIYSKWLTSKHGKPPTITTFMDSRYYKAFIEVAKFIKAVKITEIDVFIRMAIEDDLPPNMWTHDAVYSKFLQYMQQRVSAKEQMKITVNTICDLADIFECDTGDVFSHLSSGELAQIIRERKLSPWILMRSGKFKQFLIAADGSAQQMFNDLIKPMYWKMKFDKAPDDVAYAKAIVKELGI
ncbi:hypothetical protein D3C87_1102890 [compost metagenome]